MTWGNHMTEIARQGIWASLTGGWYYEPTNSMLCNTVHLYLWLILFAIPLLLGMLAVNLFSTLSVIYFIFIFALFIGVKGMVMFLHRLFDNTNPIVVEKEKEPETIQLEQKQNRRNMLYEMIELNRLNASLEGNSEDQEITEEPLSSTDRRPSIPPDPTVSFGSLDRVNRGQVSVTADVHSLRIPTFMETRERSVRAEMNLATFNKRLAETDTKVPGAMPRSYVHSMERKGSEPILSSIERSGDVDEKDLLVTHSLCANLDKGSTYSLGSKLRKAREMKVDETVVEVHEEEEEKEKKEEKVDQATQSQPSASADESEKKKEDEIMNSTEKSPSKVVVGGVSSSLDSISSSSVSIPPDPSSSSWIPSKGTPAASDDKPCCSKTVVQPVAAVEEEEEDMAYEDYVMPLYFSNPEEFLPKAKIYAFLEEIIARNPIAIEAMEIVKEKSDDDAYVSTDIVRECRITAERIYIDNIHSEKCREISVRAWDKQNKNKPGRERTVPLPPELTDIPQTRAQLQTFWDMKGYWWTFQVVQGDVTSALHVGNRKQMKEMIEIKEAKERELDAVAAAMDAAAAAAAARRRGSEGGEAGPNSLRNALQSIPEGGSSDDDEILTVRGRYERILGDSSMWTEGHPPSPPEWQPGALLGHIDPISHRISFESARMGAFRGDSSRGHGLLPNLPSNVLYVAPHEQRRGRTNRPSLNLTRQSYVPSRLVAAIRATEEIRLRNVVEAHERREAGRRRLREDQIVDDVTIREMARMQRALERSGMPDGIAARLVERSHFMPRKRSITMKRYYYDLRLIPFIKKTFRIKMDRLSLSDLFDRNQSISTIIFDLLIACLISIVSVMVLSTHIFHDVSLVMFAFVTASAHFSLMKSVQPDAASPTHGFNWQVSYSRPFYFLILSSLLLYVDGSIPDKKSVDPWNWNLYRVWGTSWPSILLSIRDLLSYFLLLMPIICTLGWLPQVSTLLHHILEQIEMIILGGTASFGPLNALAQLSRTLVCLTILVGFSILAHFIDHSTFYAVPMALIVAIAFLHSRMSSNPHLWTALVNSLRTKRRRSRMSEGRKGESAIPLRDEKGEANGDGGEDEEKEENGEKRRKRVMTPLLNNDDEPLKGSLPPPIRRVALDRVKRDLVFSLLLLVITFALHCTTVLTAAQPYFTYVTMCSTFVIGICNHYIYIHLRKHTPWKMIARPFLRPREYGMFEADQPAALMTFEKIHMWMLIIEKNVMYPLTVISCLSASSRSLFVLSPILIPIIGFRLLRSAMAVPHQIYIPLGLSFIISFVDVHSYFPVTMPKGSTWLDLLPYTWYLIAVIYPKWEELSLKLHFVLAYMAPWQITWGSAFHAFAQPFSVPHTMLITIQTIISSIISAPLNPFLGSSFITASYVRPVKFWEKDYNTERSDASNTRLASQLEKGPMLDDSNLNAVFYEHLTRSLQSVVAGDILMGRWGASVEPGDCFILASFYLNCLVHIVEVGNGYVTFQLRGLEFRGTYCHQREVEAISEDVSEGNGCCCCSPGSLPGFLSLNTAWGLRWTAWEVTTHKYIVDGYSITDNSAISLLQVHELRRLLVTLYSKCIIYFTLSNPNLFKWLENEAITLMIDTMDKIPRYVDVDHIFCTSNDEDYDSDLQGISRASFLRLYSPWIDHCMTRLTNLKQGQDQVVIGRVQTLLFSLSLLGRRALGQAAYNRHSSAAESFLFGLHSLFKGDFRITCARDEWVFAEIDLLQSVIASSVRMALKLHQDHFTVSDDLDDSRSLFYLIKRHQESLFISHEHDPAWRSAIMANVPSLLALRHMYDDGQDDYKIIMLNKMNLNMRVIKLNRECVRAFWSGQQQELVFLRNRNPERGSIQNARQVLRNMINSSADQPVGYPIYVSPLTTSFLETHPQYEGIVGAPLTIQRVSSSLRSFFSGLRDHFGLNGSNSLSVTSAALSHRLKGETAQQQGTTAKESGEESPVQMEQSVVQLTGEGARVTIVKTAVVPPEKEKGEGKVEDGKGGEEKGSEGSGGIRRRGRRDEENKILEIISDDDVLLLLHEPMKSTGETLVVWPHDKWRQATQKARIQDMDSFVGQKGMVVYTWYPNHANRALRSHCGETIHLLMMMGSAYFVPVKEKGTAPVKDTTEARISLLGEFFEEQSIESRKKGKRAAEEKARREEEEERKKEEGEKKEDEEEENEKEEKEDEKKGEESKQEENVVKKVKRCSSTPSMQKKEEETSPSSSSNP